MARAAGSTGRKRTSCRDIENWIIPSIAPSSQAFGASLESDLPQPGKSAYEMLDSMGADGGVRALLVFGSNIAVSAPHAGHIEKRLDALDFLVVSDFFLSETAARADVVLPSAQWAEEEGTMTNLEGRVILRQRAMLPPEGVRTDVEILSCLAERLGYGKFFPAHPAQVFEELRRASAGGAADYSGITWDRIRRSDGIFWPCPGEDHPGTPRLFLDRFATDDGSARFHAVPFQQAAEEPDDEFPLYLTTGRDHGAVSIGHADAPGCRSDGVGARSFRANPSFDGADVRNRRRR